MKQCTSCFVTVSFIRPVLLVEETAEFPEKTNALPQVTDKLYHIEITLVLLPINNSPATVNDSLTEKRKINTPSKITT
jgi:hypothetical protein